MKELSWTPRSRSRIWRHRRSRHTGRTSILKFYLHISKQEQLSRFQEWLDDPAKQWKISESDYKERKFWDDYMAAYEDVLSRCSTQQAPWFQTLLTHLKER